MKRKTFPIQLHRHSKLNIVCVDTSEEIETFADGEGIGIPEDKTDFQGLFAKSGQNFYIIFHNDTTPGDVSHECTHFLNCLYLSISQNLDSENDEAYCHLLSHYVDLCLRIQTQSRLNK